MNLNLYGDLEDVLFGTKELSKAIDIVINSNGLPVEVKHCEKGLEAENSNGRGVICYSKRAEFFRALSFFAQYGEKEFHIKEDRFFDFNGLMLDNSRNAVQNVDAVKKMIRHLALMGLDTLMLYTEDTYELKKYPYFGYMRGRFTGEELKELDEYASMFGVELVPCIQTLSHLNQALRWDAFSDIASTNFTLMVGEEKTYEFLDYAISTLADTFKSRKINIGMDESFDISFGNYFLKNGHRDAADIMCEHLSRVAEICRKYGFKPMMWSDMFFRMVTNGEYYRKFDKIPKEILDKVPKDVELVYWDYYSESSEAYHDMLEKHLQFNNRIAFAGGAWKWTGFAPGNQFSIKISRLALEQCRKMGVRDVIATAWGDNGAECSCFSILPVLQLFAEYGYEDKVQDEWLKDRFKTCTGGEYDAFLDLDCANLTPGNPAPGRCGVNPSKYLLYNDILCGLFDKDIKENECNSYYVDSAKKLKEHMDKNDNWGYLFRTQMDLCNLLSHKCDIGIRIKKAYDDGNKELLAGYAQNQLPEILSEIEKLHQSFYAQWIKENKVFGFDVQDIRFGGLKERLKTAAKRLNQYISGEIPCLPELEQERLPFIKNAEPPYSFNLWQNMVTSGVLTENM